MILILVSSYYKEAATFAKRFPGGAASIFTCADLAAQPIDLFYPGFERSTITIGGAAIPINAISGVINFLPEILPEELYFFPEEERDYQAAEFRALFTFFLQALPCPVINRPSASGLTGAFNHPLYWMDRARKLDIPTIPLVIDSDHPANHPPTQKPPAQPEIICLNQKIITVISISNLASNYQTRAQQYTLQLARHARVAYLKAAFEMTGQKLALARVSTVPDIRNDELIRRIIADLQKKQCHDITLGTAKR